MCQRNYFVLLFLSCFSMPFFAQNEETSLKTFEKIDMGINGFGLSVETPLSKKILSEFSIGVGPSYNINNDGPGGIADGLDWRWALLEPSFHASVYGKFYYNRENRFKKKKTLLLNSGNFIGLKAKYVSKSLSDPQYYSNTLLFNLNWGMQRNLGKHWTYSCSFGLGYGYNMDNPCSVFYPALDLKFSYVLPFFDKGKK